MSWRWSPFGLERVAFDVSIADQNAVSHSGAAEPVHVASPFSTRMHWQGPLAELQPAEKTKTDKYKLLCQQRGMDFEVVPSIFTTSGGMGEQFQRQYWKSLFNY